MIPAIEIPAVAEQLEQDWKGEHNDNWNAFNSRVMLTESIDGIIHNHARRMDEKRWYSFAGKELLPLFAWEGDEAVCTTRDAIDILARLKKRHSNRLYFDGAVASMKAADQSGSTTAIGLAVNDFKMFIYNTL